jgi:hypothetical protein
MPRIAISYRRDDSAAVTGRIFDRLVAHYDVGSVFRDIDNIPLGVDFREHINTVLARTDITLVVVGKRWSGPQPRRRRRIDDPADPVRVEVETALRNGIPVVPVLVEGAAMPNVEQLPDSLKDLVYRNGLEVDSGRDFDQHIERLIRSMEPILARRAEELAEGDGQRAEEEKQQAEAARLTEEERQRAEAARQAEEEKRRAAAARQAKEEKQRAEAARQAKEEKQRAAAAQQAKEEKQRAAAAQQAKEEKQRAVAARQAKEEKQRAEAAKHNELGAHRSNEPLTQGDYLKPNTDKNDWVVSFLHKDNKGFIISMKKDQSSYVLSFEVKFSNFRDHLRLNQDIINSYYYPGKKTEIISLPGHEDTIILEFDVGGITGNTIKSVHLSINGKMVL